MIIIQYIVRQNGKERKLVQAFVSLITVLPFYARKQNASRVFAIVWASVRPYVCHTRGLYQNGAS